MYNHDIAMKAFRDQLVEEALGIPSTWDDRETRKRKRERRIELAKADKARVRTNSHKR